jgi:hypothetical protein
MNCTQVKQLTLILIEGVSVCVLKLSAWEHYSAISGSLVMTARHVLGLWMEENK